MWKLMAPMAYSSPVNDVHQRRAGPPAPESFLCLCGLSRILATFAPLLTLTDFVARIA